MWPSFSIQRVDELHGKRKKIKGDEREGNSLWRSMVTLVETGIVKLELDASQVSVASRSLRSSDGNHRSLRTVLSKVVTNESSITRPSLHQTKRGSGFPIYWLVFVVHSIIKRVESTYINTIKRFKQYILIFTSRCFTGKRKGLTGCHWS